MLINRVLRTIRYEEVYLKIYDTVLEAKKTLSKYIEWYNHERRHSYRGVKKKRRVETRSWG